MKRVIILTHGHYQDRRTGATFHEQVMFNPEPGSPEGSKVRLGVAEDVAPEHVREFYLGHRKYQVEGYTDAELYPEGVPKDVLALREATEAVEAPQEPPKAPESPVDADGPAEAGEAQAAAAEPIHEANPMADVDFTSDNAREAAATFGLTKADFEGMVPTGASGGLTVADVRKANKNRKASA